MDVDDETGRRLISQIHSTPSPPSVGHFPLGRSSSLTPSRSVNQFGSPPPPSFVIACPLKFSHAAGETVFSNTTIIAKTRIHLFPALPSSLLPSADALPLPPSLNCSSYVTSPRSPTRSARNISYMVGMQFAFRPCQRDKLFVLSLQYSFAMFTFVHLRSFSAKMQNEQRGKGRV